MPVTSRHPSFHVQVCSSGAEPGIWQLLFSAVYFTVVQPIFLPPLPSPPPCIHSLWLLPSERLAAAVLLMGAGWIPFCLSPLPTFLIVLRALSWHSRESTLLLPSACCGGQKWNKGVKNVRKTLKAISIFIPEVISHIRSLSLQIMCMLYVSEIGHKSLSRSFL